MTSKNVTRPPRLAPGARVALVAPAGPMRLDPDPMHRLGIGFLFGTLGLFLQSATEWTYKQTPVLFTFHVMMGALAALYYARRHGLPAERRPSLAPAINVRTPVPAAVASTGP